MNYKITRTYFIKIKANQYRCNVAKLYQYAHGETQEYVQ